MTMGMLGGIMTPMQLGAGHAGQGEALAVPLFQHGGDHHAAHRGHGGRAGAGDSGKEHTDHHGDDGQTAGHPAQEHVTDVQDPLGHAA